jgi:hypothetical protein
MKHRQFVCGSAVLLGVWLALTFFREVPSQRYPRLEKHRKTAEVKKPEEPHFQLSQASIAE